MTAPNPQAQELMLRNAYRRAGIAPAQVDYIECHGSATPLGDPIEANAIGAVLGAGRDEPLRLGSVKSNVGHLEAAAGIVGLVKLALSIRNGVLPPSLHYAAPNPQIMFEEYNLTVQDRLTAWPRRSDARRGGVSSFGFGGAIAMSSWRNCRAPKESSSCWPGIHARRWWSGPQRCATSTTFGRSCQLPRMKARSGSGHRPLDERAQNAAGRLHRRERGRGAERRRRTTERAPRVAFLFSGNGSQWVGMGRQLLAGLPCSAGP